MQDQMEKHINEIEQFFIEEYKIFRVKNFGTDQIDDISNNLTDKNVDSILEKIMKLKEDLKKRL